MTHDFSDLFRKKQEEERQRRAEEYARSKNLGELTKDDVKKIVDEVHQLEKIIKEIRKGG